jgi:hypothetical protein
MNTKYDFCARESRSSIHAGPHYLSRLEFAALWLARPLRLSDGTSAA